MKTLSNGRYAVTLAASGAGYSTWNDYALTAWSEEGESAAEGFFFYVTDRDTQLSWSVTPRPMPAADGVYESLGGADRVMLRSVVDDIEATLEVGLLADTDGERRRLVLRNQGSRPRRLAVTTCAEVVVNTAGAHAAHPAFSKLFVQTELVDGILLARRRPRADGESHPWLAHACLDGVVDGIETDRVRFIGRGRSLRRPRALGHPLSGTTGNVLDPVLALRRSVELAPGGQIELTFALVVGESRAAALAAIRGHMVSGTESKVVPPSSPSPPAIDLPEHGWSRDGREYLVHLRPHREGGLVLPPMPWVNVIANENFGFLASETGAGCTWSRNSREHRLTPWANDPVSDPHGEALFVRDEGGGSVWSPQPGPLPAVASYEVRHGFGYSTWEHTSHGIEHLVTEFVPRHLPVKITRLRLRNTRDRSCRLDLFSYRRLVLGGLASSTRSVVTTEFDATDEVLYACHPQSVDFGDGVVFAAVAGNPAGSLLSHSGDRSAWIDGFDDAPALAPGSVLDDRTGAGLDPCAALHLGIEIEAGASIEVAFLLGEARSRDEAAAIVTQLRGSGAIDAELTGVTEFWRSTLGTLQVSTPSPALDTLLNGWLLYQTMSCRLWGRSAFYQSGGAFGFRDQLQDSCALLYARPDLTRAQLLLHAAHQFVEGDVLHWWHPPAGRGTRTRFSDDLLWLPYLTSVYVESSGDVAVLDEPAGFVEARRLEPGEDEAYLETKASSQIASLYEHCCLSIERSLTKGRHGLPLMGTGDWNDGMNRVGREGRGESVWVGFFLFRLLGHFLPLCRARGDAERVGRYAAFRDELQVALDAAWDGEWYRRAYYDDGTPLGSAQNVECRIDALAQAWAVLSKAVPRERAEQAMAAVERELVDREAGIVRLLAPPFDRDPHDPGYIKGYVPGIRENGGQYTHAALWVVEALAQLGRRDEAAGLLERLTPAFHSRSAEQVAIYQVEPYVVAADIYGTDPHVGRGGWTWYTGSAAWMYRIGVESILGLRRHAGAELHLRPCIPRHWPSFTIRYQVPGEATVYDIEVINHGAPQVTGGTIDDQPITIDAGTAIVPLQRDGARHRVVVEM